MIKFALPTLTAFALTSFSAHAADRPLVSYQGLSAFVSGTGDWCASAATVNVSASDPAAFKNADAKLSRLVGGLRTVLSAECPAAQSIHLIGLVDGAKVYEGSASAQAGWALAEIVPPTEAELKLVADLNEISRCDDEAAHPSDPEALGKGVSDERLDAESAIAACTKAVAIDGETPRLHFQLGRAYWKAGRLEDAVDALLPAAEAGHGGALAYLGDIYLSGAGDIEADPIQARTLYQKALDAGFSPAAQVIAGFEDQTKQLADAEAEERKAVAAIAVADNAPSQKAGLNLSGYERPEVISAVWNEDYENSGLKDLYFISYLINMAQIFRAACPGSITITELNKWKARGLATIDMSPQSVMDNLTSMLGMIVEVRDNPQAMTKYAMNSAEIDSLPDMAAEDAGTFLSRNSCSSPAFSRFKEHMSIAVLNP